ncbi:4Fe-4S dicluster domain-containing protein [Slackia heliotrinireducens]|uniref:Fe-S-cluster-containing hydrogenase subunit n=1 Tax=Slackia heliotrinireducens (strain ATCC 29202 / DSM 20476 / NCTC 11029 / RHS 1) TaxID=471855 RepID=C7N163_SLAHD|nr:4Fe-4S dicluster domain-containing protein [Slackia heliotrinireducens]ACV23285.1 Fe-S-cluster-containing hydrogenase subunit [Slackia heliotrinireducens DSM 20476]VEH02458.1 DMSO reductase iron-sulfur subunit [Slackia heliotrinireducens]
MAQYSILTDLNRCVGCMSCMVACKAINDVPIGNYWNKILRIGPYKREDYQTPNDVDMYYLCVQCQHCADPKCVAVCPTKASQKMEDGTVQIDKSKCIGCQFCVMACPYGVRYLNEEERVVEKCTMCEQLIAQGGLPQCVVQCGGRARFFGDLDNGIESFEAPDIAYIADRDNNDFSYDQLYTGNRITFGELAEEYNQDTDVHRLPDAGNEPSFVYVLRGREWKGAE